jgi:hypothetical protein
MEHVARILDHLKITRLQASVCVVPTELDRAVIAIYECPHTSERAQRRAALYIWKDVSEFIF